MKSGQAGIFAIELQEVLPLPLKNNVPPGSIWLTRQTILPETYYLIKAPSGRGKTTLLSMLFGLRTDFEGKILLNHRDLATLTRGELTLLRQTHMAIVPQDLRLFPELSARQNCMLAPGADPTKIKNLADRLQISQKIDVPCALLSFGQQQRVALIRALCRPFSLLLLDEPFSHLDEDNIHMANECILNELAANKATLLLSSLGSQYSFPFHHTLSV